MAQATVGRATGERATGTTDPRPARRAAEWRRTLALFLCFAGFYLLTTSGHFYAVDEETLYVLTESLGARGTFEIPRGAWGMVLSPQSPPPGPAYSIFPPGQPFVALPLFLLGRLFVPLFPPDAEGYVLRFFTSLLNPLVTAATVALLYRLSRALGYGGRPSLALAVIYGLATTAWVQGRTYFAEPLTALLLVLSFYGILNAERGTRNAESRSGEGEALGPPPGQIPRSAFRVPRSLVLAGFAAAASLTVKPHAAIALPALGLYLLARGGDLRREGGRWRFDARAALRACAAFGAGGLLVAIPYGALNWALFGGPLSTAYGTSPLSGFTHPFLRGLYGLTVSTGRGIVWFSPPLILALIGARRFFRRHPAEALACLGVVVAHYAFYCGHFEWAGGGAWGPRYLMIALPFAFLPIAGFFELLRERRALVPLAGVVVTAGVAVQLLAVGLNFDYYMIGDEEEHNFSPAASPLLWHARTINARAREWYAVTFPPADTIGLRGGFAARESERQREPLPRWTTGAGDMTIYAAANTPHTVKLTFFDHRPAALRDAPAVLINGTALPDGAIERVNITGDGEGWTYRFAVPADAFRFGRATITLRSATWNPARAGQGDRDEHLGVFVHNVEAWRGDVPLALGDIPNALRIPPMPRTPRHRFWWHNSDHEHHHLTDNWAWYAAVAGFPRDLTIRWIGGFAAFCALLIAAGLALGLRALPAGAPRPARQRRRRRGKGYAPGKRGPIPARPTP